MGGDPCERMHGAQVEMSRPTRGPRFEVGARVRFTYYPFTGVGGTIVEMCSQRRQPDGRTYWGILLNEKLESNITHVAESEEYLVLVEDKFPTRRPPSLKSQGDGIEHS